jgi:hypothetical protein
VDEVIEIEVERELARNQAEPSETPPPPVTGTTNQADEVTDPALKPERQPEREPEPAPEPQIELVLPQEDTLLHQLADSLTQDDPADESPPGVLDSGATATAKVLYVCTYPTWQDPNRTDECHLILF